LEAEVAEGQLLKARKDYDDRVRLLSSPEGYASYREEEALKPARMEAGNIQQFLITRNAALSDESLAALSLALRERNVPASALHGPYDPLPHVRMGDELLDWSDQQVAVTQEIGNGVLQTLAQSGSFSREELNLIHEYFLNKTSQLQQRTALVKEHLAGSQSTESDGSLSH
jgi:hypothetical protein